MYDVRSKMSNIKRMKIMKKIYLSPNMEVIEIKTTCMLAASLPKSDTEITGSGEILAPGQSDIEW